MLRRPDQTDSPAVSADETAIPSLDEPFVLASRPLGVRFYQGRESFFHSYALLQSVRLQSERLILSFATAEIIITGRALHALYVHLAEQRIACIVEQGERYAKASDAVTFIRRIEETPK